MDNTIVKKCPVCGNDAKVIGGTHPYYDYVECPVCGMFKMFTTSYSEKPTDKNKLASYLFYNGKLSQPIKVKPNLFFNFIGKKNAFESQFEETPYCYHVTNDIVENWYPKTFSDKVNKFLMALSKESDFIGKEVVLSKEQLFSALFVKRYDCKNNILKSTDMLGQAKKMLDYIKDKNYIDYSYNNHSETCGMALEPDGWNRIDELQSSRKPKSKSVFIAMSFADDMMDTRETIKKAIVDSGYIPRVMDEIEHNHQIVPEMLYEIRESRFVIAEFTGHNNGAYFEAGYALGIGKDVIQVCSKEKFNADCHFDVKQINTIIWKSQDDLYEKLINRIKATIE